MSEASSDWLLRYQSGSAAGQAFPVGDEPLLLGTGLAAAPPLADAGVAVYHASARRAGDGVVVEALAGGGVELMTRSSWVRVDRLELDSPADLRIGTVRLVLLRGAVSSGPAPAGAHTPRPPSGEPLGPQPEDAFSQMLLGPSAAMRGVRERLRRLAPLDCDVLLLGETGTGKEVATRALVKESKRAEGSFVAVNCAAIPGELLESELFGHVRGAFSGATSARTGELVKAHGGVLLLDEIGELRLDHQAKLLRVLETREVTPVGANKPVPVDVRIVFATRADLPRMVRQGTFRDDLFYRISPTFVTLPPLRDRDGDREALTRSFATKYKVPEADLPRLLERVRLLDLSGNVRELHHFVQRCSLMGVEAEHLDLRVERDALGRMLEGALVAGETAFREAYFRRLYERSGGHAPTAAELAGYARQNVNKQWKALKLLVRDEGHEG